MFDLGKKGPKLFEFDLEKQLKKNKDKTHELKKHVDHQVHETKKHLRDGGNKEELDQYGKLLQGYVALQKVLTRITTT